MFFKISNIINSWPVLTTFLLALSAAVIVGSAWIFEFSGYQPCQMCLWQRIPYYITIPLLFFSSAAIALNIFSKRTLSFAIFGIGIIFVISVALAAYHSGVEWGFWPGPSSCGVSTAFPTIAAKDLLAAISDIKPPSCDEAAGRFLGLSFAGWNFVASVMLSIASFVTANAISTKNEVLVQ